MMKITNMSSKTKLEDMKPGAAFLYRGFYYILGGHIALEKNSVWAWNISKNEPMCIPLDEKVDIVFPNPKIDLGTGYPWSS